MGPFIRSTGSGPLAHEVYEVDENREDVLVAAFAEREEAEAWVRWVEGRGEGEEVPGLSDADTGDPITVRDVREKWEAEDAKSKGDAARDEDDRIANKFDLRSDFY